MMVDSKRLGLAGGILMAFCMLVMSIFAMNSTDGCMMVPMMMMPMMSSIEMSGSGVIVAIIAGFVHGFIALFLLGWLYNRLPHSKKR
jgi:fructose-specific phosphotransferase system IIC component